METVLRRILPEDDPAVAAVIRAVMPTFGAQGPGFALSDPEVDGMCAAYAEAGHAYFVVEQEGRVVGGGGVGPLVGGSVGVCELRKMYFLPEARGRGTGERLLSLCLDTARELSYRTCYLETLANMDAAQRLYVRAGFRRLDAPWGGTGHFGCDRWYAIDLAD